MRAMTQRGRGRKRDWADREAERLVVKFWNDIEGHWFGSKLPIAKLEMGIARSLRRVELLARTRKG